MKNNRKGFTLIELLVVVLIIGILASVAIPQYFKVVEKSRVTETKTLYGAVRGAQGRFQPSTGAFTTNIALLDLTFPMAGASIDGKFYRAAVTAASAAGFTLTCTRKAGGPATYGAYTVTFAYVVASGATTISCGGANCGQLIDCNGAASCAL